MKIKDSVICLTDLCNYRCIFCSRWGTHCANTPAAVKKTIKLFPDDVCFEGGEPMLAPDLEKWVAFAKAEQVKDIILVTNGFGLGKPAVVEKMLKAGVTMFNVNFPAHDQKLFGLLTQRKGNFKKTVRTVKNLIKTAGPGKVRLTLVANSIIIKYIKDYGKFLVKNFPGISYLEINMVKVLGAVKKRKWLVPRLTELKPYLLEAFYLLEQKKVCFITDGFPLCIMEGFEDHAIDTRFLINYGRPATQEKRHAGPCRLCTLNKICPGPRRDYLRIYGFSELKPSVKDPAAIIETTRKRWLSAPHRTSR